EVIAGYQAGRPDRLQGRQERAQVHPTPRTGAHPWIVLQTVMKVLARIAVPFGIALACRAVLAQPGSLADMSPSLPSEHFRFTPNGAMFNNLTGSGGLIERAEATHRAVKAFADKLGVPTTQPAGLSLVILCSDSGSFHGMATEAGFKYTDTLL